MQMRFLRIIAKTNCCNFVIDAEDVVVVVVRKVVVVAMLCCCRYSWYHCYYCSIGVIVLLILVADIHGSCLCC